MLIPRNPDDLTSEWLTEALRSKGALSHQTVTSFAEGRPTDTKGHMGLIVRINLGYDSPEPSGSLGPQGSHDPKDSLGPSGLRAPASIIAKFSSAIAEMRARPNTRSGYEREVRFYQHIADSVSLRTPECYYCDFDSDTGYHVILLEDLAPARGANRSDGVTPDQAKLAVHQIAEFHATWWESDRMEDLLSWLPKVQPPDPVAMRKMHDAFWPDFLRQTDHLLSDRVRDLGSRLGEHKGQIFQHFRSRPHTLVHSDFNADNMMFGDPDSDVPFAVVDCHPRKAPGMSDVGGFLFESLLPDDRRAVDRDLLRDYVRILADYGVDYPFSNVETDYRYCILSRYGSLISTIAAMPFTQEQIQMHIEVFLPRCISAIEDNDAESVLP